MKIMYLIISSNVKSYGIQKNIFFNEISIDLIENNT